MKKDNYVDLGFCRKVHGIKGEFQFKLDNPHDSILSSKSKVYLVPLPGSELVEDEYIVESIRFGNKVICKIVGVTDRNMAESYIPFQIKFHRDQFPQPAEDEFYLNDLIGCDVIDSRTQRNIGSIEKLYFSGAQDIAVISLDKGSLELPIIEQFFLDINIETKQVTVLVPDYIE